MPTKEDLKYFQSMPLDIKISLTQSRIREWVRQYGTSGVYVSFSGGKDSTVLLHIVRQMYPDVEAVFVDTGLEYPEIKEFVKTFDNVTILRPKIRFDEVIKKYGYPIIGKRQANAIELGRNNIKQKKYSWRLKILGIEPEKASQKGLTLPNKTMLKRYAKSSSVPMFNCNKYRPLLFTDFKISAKCCGVMKKSPLFEYQKVKDKKPIIATMATESLSREMAWLKNGCNAFEAKHPQSTPMSFWTEQDVFKYIRQYNIPIASIYGDVVYSEKPEQMRIDELIGDYRETEKLITTGYDRTGCIFCGFGCHLDKEPSRFQRLKETHPRQYDYCINGGEYVDGVWQPNKRGLGLKHVFDTLNNIYGENFIKYE